MNKRLVALNEISSIEYNSKYQKYKIKDSWCSEKQLSFFIKKYIRETKITPNSEYFFIKEDDNISVYNFKNLINRVILKDTKRNDKHIISVIVDIMKILKNDNIIHLTDWNIKQKNHFFNTELYEEYFKDCNKFSDCVSIFENDKNMNVYDCDTELKEPKDMFIRKLNKECIKYFKEKLQFNKEITTAIFSYYFKSVKDSISKKRLNDMDINAIGHKRCGVCSIFKDTDNYTKEQFKIICDSCSVIKREKEIKVKLIEDNVLCDMCKECRTPIKKDKILCRECYIKED